jgi:hypothetical protein
MKKSYLLIALLSLVFLWFGNISFADVVCEDWSTKCPSTSDCSCIEDVDIHGQSYTPPKFTCDACLNTSWIANSLNDTTEVQEPLQNVPCEGTFPKSKLDKDPNATMSIPGISCACKKWYGEYYNADWVNAWKTTCELCSLEKVCCGTKLNTKIPFIGDCIESSTQASGSVITETTAFPILVTALVKILISVILIASFVLIVAAGVMIATGDSKWGKDMIVKVAIGLAILGASGVILRLINPNFFG